MLRKTPSINDQLYRSRSRNAAEERRMPSEQRRRRQIRSWIILVALVVLVLLGIRFLGGSGTREDPYRLEPAAEPAEE